MTLSVLPGRWTGSAEPAWLAGCAAFAAGFALLAGTSAHRAWGAVAAVAYGFVALGGWIAGPRHARAVRAAAVAGAGLIPLLILVRLGLRQEEVTVVARSAGHLLAHGTPYAAGGPAGDYASYNPYLPGMSLFGLTGSDPRPAFAAVLAAGLALSLRARRAGAEPLMFVLASPLVALTLATGGDDLPVIGLTCLGLSLAVRRPGTAGLVLGFAATLKATAWPALLVGLLLAGSRRRFGGAAGAVVAAGIAPAFLVDPHAFVRNVVLFPLGLTPARSPASSPLPGRLLADFGPAGHAAALALLLLAGLAMAAWLLRRPPADAPAAARALALGLTLAACLMPATRWGYLVYPAVLAAWSLVPRHPAPATPTPPAEPVVRAADASGGSGGPGGSGWTGAGPGFTDGKDVPCLVVSSSPTTSRPAEAA